MLYVRDAAASASWYHEVFGFGDRHRDPRLRRRSCAPPAPTTTTTSGCSPSVPTRPDPEQGRVGLYHLAWQVGSIHDLVTARDDLLRVGAYTGESDHGATKSIYGKDPDGNEFEIMWMVPRDEWTADDADTATIAHLDLDAEVARHGSDRPSVEGRGCAGR